jgi:hypothetical protein
MANTKFGYLQRFVLEKDGSTIYLHDPANGIYNRHYVMESIKYRVRAQETADNILIDMDYGNRSPVEYKQIDQEIFVQKSSLTAVLAYTEALEAAGGWGCTLYKMNALGTVTQNIKAKMEHVEYIEPVRDAKKQCVLRVTFFIFGRGWN